MTPETGGAGRRRIGLAALGAAVWLAVAVGLEILLGRRVPISAGGWIVAAVAVAVYVAQARWIERREPGELAVNRLVWVFPGAGIGAGLFCATMALLAAIGCYRFGGFSSWAPLAGGIGFALMTGVVEELLFRGFVFRWMQNGLGTWIAIGFSAALFGALHGFNPGATAVSTFAIALEAGVILSAAYVYSGNLWMPIGLHAAWNFTEGTVFGVAVSGGHVAGVLSGSIRGPVLLTGGAFGVEASVLAVLVSLCASAALLYGAWRRGRIVPPPGQR
jgi:CAAX protease family protein